MPHLISGEPLSYHLYTADGVQTDFTFNKGYLAQAHVHVQIGELAQVQGLEYTWADEETIRFKVAPDAGAEVLLARHTPIEPIVQYEDGNVDDAHVKQRVYDQNLYWHQEQQDQLDRTLKIDERTFIDANALEIALPTPLVQNLVASDTPLALLQTRGTLKLRLSISESGKLAGELVFLPSAPSTVISGEECPA